MCFCTRDNHLPGWRLMSSALADPLQTEPRCSWSMDKMGLLVYYWMTWANQSGPLLCKLTMSIYPWEVRRRILSQSESKSPWRLLPLRHHGRLSCLDAQRSCHTVSLRRRIVTQLCHPLWRKRCNWNFANCLSTYIIEKKFYLLWFSV